MTGLQAQNGEPRDCADRYCASPDFESFFRAHYPVVVRLAQGVVGEPQAAQDVAQEVFLSAFRRFSGDYEDAGGWVRVAAVHTALNVLRGERRREQRHLRRPAGGSVPSAEEVAIDREARAELRRALGRLPGRSATVVVMRHSGLSYLEIASALGVKVGQVGTLLRRAESALRKEMERAARS